MRGPLARSSIQTTCILGLRISTQAVILVLLTRLLSPSIYGAYAAAAALAIVMGSLPNLGSGYILMSRATRQASGAADTWRYAWPITIGLGIFLLGIYLAIGSYVTEGDRVPIGDLLLLGSAELLLTPFTLLLSFALQANERVPLSQVVQWVPLGLRIAAVAPCFLYEEPRRLTMFLSLQLLASFVGLAVGAWITLKHVQLDWRPRRATAWELKAGSSYAAMQLVAYNPSELDKIVALRTLGPHAAGIYTASARMMAALAMPIIAVVMSAQPRLFRHAEDPGRKNHRLVRTIGLLALAWGLVSGLLLTLFGPLLPLLFGNAYLETEKLAPWLAITPLFLCLRLAAGNILVALGRPLERLAFELGGILLLIVGMLWLAPRLGVFGLIAAVIVAEACMALIGWLLIRQRLRHHAAVSPADGR